MLLVIVRVPTEPGSIEPISPGLAVLLNAPAKVRHGAVRLQGFASSPTPETHVRVACANPGVAIQRLTIEAANSEVTLRYMMLSRRNFVGSELLKRHG